MKNSNESFTNSKHSDRYKIFENSKNVFIVHYYYRWTKRICSYNLNNLWSRARWMILIFKLFCAFVFFLFSLKVVCSFVVVVADGANVSCNLILSCCCSIISNIGSSIVKSMCSSVINCLFEGQSLTSYQLMKLACLLAMACSFDSCWHWP